MAWIFRNKILLSLGAILTIVVPLIANIATIYDVAKTIFTNSDAHSGEGTVIELHNQAPAETTPNATKTQSVDYESWCKDSRLLLPSIPEANIDLNGKYIYIPVCLSNVGNDKLAIQIYECIDVNCRKLHKYRKYDQRGEIPMVHLSYSILKPLSSNCFFPHKDDNVNLFGCFLKSAYRFDGKHKYFSYNQQESVLRDGFFALIRAKEYARYIIVARSDDPSRHGSWYNMTFSCDYDFCFLEPIFMKFRINDKSISISNVRIEKKNTHFSLKYKICLDLKWSEINDVPLPNLVDISHIPGYNDFMIDVTVQGSVDAMEFRNFASIGPGQGCVSLQNRFYEPKIAGALLEIEAKSETRSLKDGYFKYRVQEF